MIMKRFRLLNSCLPGICLTLLILVSGCALLEDQPYVPSDYSERSLIINGRSVSVKETGAPNGYPVFYAHGNPGSSSEIQFFQTQAKQQGFRLIAIDRPGFGDSPFITPYPLTDYGNDISSLADRLGIEDYGVMGWSSGGPPSLAAAYRDPRRVRFVISADGYTNFGEFPDAEKALAELGRKGAQVSEDKPRLFSAVLNLSAWTEQHVTPLYLLAANATLTESDRSILKNGQYQAIFNRVQQEALSQGAAGVKQDLETQWAPWEFTLDQITTPVLVIQGEADTFVPVSFAQHLCEKLPRCELHLIAEQGHLAPLTPAAQDAMFRFARKVLNGQALFDARLINHTGIETSR
ncbi:MAG: alpha/beta hydrolase [Hahellaceae bacterium]|jgi:pimeloyl-ACP methyl ester carboxylesterase|nr:alpha/beta hydrolase [Hahellaceae bacterium]